MANLKKQINTAPGRVLPRRSAPFWPLALSIGVGILAGVGTYTFRYAKGLSYFSTEPSACVNCHIMQPQYDGWQKSSHHAVAVCVDCHLPQAFFPKYLAKAEAGWRHSEKFTTQDFHEPIFVQDEGRKILQDNCVRCHQRLVAAMTTSTQAHADQSPSRFDYGQHNPALECVHCHATVGHGERAGLGGPLRPFETATAPRNETMTEDEP